MPIDSRKNKLRKQKARKKLAQYHVAKAIAAAEKPATK